MKPSEDELLAFLHPFLVSDGKEILVPNGDDALALDVGGEKAVLLTVDTSLEDVHFTLDLLSFREIGFRAVAGALSDIAAMGGIPITILIDLEIPEFNAENIREIYEGIEELKDMFHFSIGGGNIVKGPRWRITTTVVGEVEKGYILKRSSFKPKDNIYITGDLGRVLFYLEHYNKPDPLIEKGYLREKFARPIPRIKEIQALKSKYKIHGAIDISDGLGLDLTRVAKSSNVKIVINLEKVPFWEKLKIFEQDKEKLLMKVVSSGEEYEVCFSSPDTIQEDGVHWIGYVEEGSGGVIGKIGSKSINISNLGYDHLST